MTVISGSNNYALATLLSQTANKQASTAGALTPPRHPCQRESPLRRRQTC